MEHHIRKDIAIVIGSVILAGLYHAVLQPMLGG